jgi:hypothetical protein
MPEWLQEKQENWNLLWGKPRPNSEGYSAKEGEEEEEEEE